MSNSPSAKKYADHKNLPCRPRYRRLRLPGIPSSPTSETKEAIPELDADRKVVFELPTLNSNRITKKHRYFYCVSDTGKSTFFDGLVKYDAQTRTAKTWSVFAQSAGEPIFVPRDRDIEGDEDDGVLLSVVLEGTAGKTMTEVDRASVNGVVGYGFHGTHVPSGRRGIDF